MNFLSMLGNAASQAANLEMILKNVNTYVNTSILVVLAIAAAVVIFYAIYIAWRMMKAEDEGQRKDAKGHLVYAICGVVAIAVIGALLTLALGAMTPKIVDPSGGKIPGVNDAIIIANTAMDSVLKIISTAAVVFAVYVGWKFISAETDDKRKNAKMQLLYTVIGIVGVVVFAVLASTVLGALATNNSTISSS